MTTIPRFLRGGFVILGALALVGLPLAGCGGSSSTGTVSAAATEGASVDDATAPRVAVVKATAAAKHPPVIVNSEGMTVYEFRRDNPMTYQFERDPVPTCYAACAMRWFPLLTDDPPKAMEGAEAQLLGTIERRDGGLQVTYDGHPLYLFAGDEQPGEMHGDDARSYGAWWHAIERDGDEYIAAVR
jgi:predicted lipoprotein with Yx(FWY)xxD motif